MATECKLWGRGEASTALATRNGGSPAARRFLGTLILLGLVARAIEAARADTQGMEVARDAARVKVAAETTRTYLDACAYA